MLALYSRKPESGQGKSNILRTFEKSSAFSLLLCLCLGLFLAPVESYCQIVPARYLSGTTVKQLIYKRTARFGSKFQHCKQLNLLILDKMSRYFTVWGSFGILSSLLLVVGAVECSEKETLLKPVSNTGTQITECLMECTGMTYIKKLQLQDNHNIRLKDSTEGDLGEYCWSTELKCTIGESFQHAYVVLPVDVSADGHEQLEVKATVPTVTTLRAHNSATTIADNCGLRYDVTPHFSTETAGASFCVQVVAPEDVLGDKVLKCPPFLVTFWQRKPNQSNQEGGG